MVSKNYLTEKEITLLDIMWKNKNPMTSVEMLKALDEAVWNETNLFRTINTLSKKNLIRICGRERYNTQYARVFEPTITREEYAARFLVDRGIGHNSLGRLAMALVHVEENGNDDSRAEETELIAELEAIIDKLRKR